MKKSHWLSAVCGAATGIINGLFGAGGGMLLVPLLRKTREFEDTEIFPASISIVLPICIVTLSVYGCTHPLPWRTALPYLIGSAIGGIIAGILGRRIPVTWLHRILGILVLWGGIRYLW